MLLSPDPHGRCFSVHLPRTHQLRSSNCPLSPYVAAPSRLSPYPSSPSTAAGYQTGPAPPGLPLKGLEKHAVPSATAAAPPLIRWDTAPRPGRCCHFFPRTARARLRRQNSDHWPHRRQVPARRRQRSAPPPSEAVGAADVVAARAGARHPLPRPPVASAARTTV